VNSGGVELALVQRCEHDSKPCLPYIVAIFSILLEGNLLF